MGFRGFDHATRLRTAATLLGVLALGACGSNSSSLTVPEITPTPSSSMSSPAPSISPSPSKTPTLAPTTPRPTATAIRTPTWTPSRTPTRRPSTPPPPPPPPPIGGANNRLWVEGDSVLLGTTVTLPAALHGWRVTMDCVGSRRLPQAITVLQANRSRLGAVVVIQMGNNYIAGEDGTFASQIDQAMRVMSAVKRVVWVTVAEKWPSRVMINQAIRAAASRWPTIRVADWAPIIASHPSYADDMLHLTPAGRLAISQLIARTVGPAPS